MKTFGRITTTLALLLGLYVLSYWLLVKERWLHSIMSAAAGGGSYADVYDAVHKVFEPIDELDSIWNVDIPTIKYLTGHWHSDTNSDFVTIGPNQECLFQLGRLTFQGTAKYNRSEGGFIMEFLHQDQMYFVRLTRILDLFGLGGAESASATVGPTYVDPFERKTDYETTLTKQAPNAPAR